MMELCFLISSLHSDDFPIDIVFLFPLIFDQYRLSRGMRVLDPVAGVGGGRYEELPSPQGPLLQGC